MTEYTLTQGKKCRCGGDLPADRWICISCLPQPVIVSFELPKIESPNKSEYVLKKDRESST